VSALQAKIPTIWDCSSLVPNQAESTPSHPEVRMGPSLSSECPVTRSASETGQVLILDNSQSVLQYSQFAVESMLGGIDLKPILEEQSCFLGGSAQFGTLVDVA